MSDLRHTLALLRAGRWNEAHDLIQRDDSMLAAWLHGLLHLQEGDLEDAENWYNRAARHFRSRGSLEEELALFEAALGREPSPWAAGPPQRSEPAKPSSLSEPKV